MIKHYVLYNLPVKVVIYGALLLFCYSCDDEFKAAVSMDQKTLQWQEEWPAFDIQGKISIRAIPDTQSDLAPVILPNIQNQIAQGIAIQFPNIIRSTGFVSIAEDLVNEEEIINTEVWSYASDFPELISINLDQDQFSTSQFLFNLTPWYQDISYNKSKLFYQFHVYSDLYPPYLFKKVSVKNRINLTLPTQNELITIQGKILQNLYLGQGLEGAEVVAFLDQHPISSKGMTNNKGEFSIQTWLEYANQEVTLLIKPSKEQRLPILFGQVTLPRDKNSQFDKAIIYPSFDKLNSFTMNLLSDDLSEDSQQWHAYLYQEWTDFQSFAQDSLLEQTTSLWTQSRIFEPQKNIRLDGYNHQATLFLHPPTTDTRRSMRVAIDRLGEQQFLQIQPQLKSVIRGKVIDELNQGVVSQIKATQHSWIWDDAYDLPLGEYWTQSDVNGDFILSLDPGEYTLQIQSKAMLGLAPKMVMITVGEDLGLIIPTEKTTLKKGNSIYLYPVKTLKRINTTVGEGEFFPKIEIENLDRDRFDNLYFSIYCQVPIQSHVLNHRIPFEQSNTHTQVILTKGFLNHQQFFQFVMAQDSCPVMIDVD